MVILLHFEQTVLQLVHLIHLSIIPLCFKNECNNISSHLLNDFEQSSENSFIASLNLENVSLKVKCYAKISNSSQNHFISYNQ